MMFNLAEKEKEILAFWEKEHIFEKSLAKNKGKKSFVFYDGPPFATGLPHYGHILASTIKDVIPRYFTMRGYYTRRRWGWDCHGLPIENIIEQQLKISGKKEIEKIGVEVFNKTCREAVLQYAGEWGKMVKRIARWVEFDNSYKTMDSAYMESVWWALRQIWDKGLLYEGRKVLLYCSRCETPISNFEVAMDQSYRDLKEEAVTVKFKIKEPEKHKLPKFVYLLAWTTTPWTLPGNVALAVGEGIDYIVVKQGKEYYILAEAREGILNKSTHEIIKKLKGKDLVGLEYDPLFGVKSIKETGKKSYYTAAADFVSTEEGTGIVHTAVVYGEDDYNLGIKLDLPVVPLLNEQGVFNEKAPALVRGKYFEDSEKFIKEDLEARGLLYKKEEYIHSYPLCWRCGTKLFYNAIPAWFINIQKIKPRLLELNENIHWYPKHLKHGRFAKGIENAPDWNISRNRYWATPIPIWQCVDKGCGHKICVGSFDELKEKAINYRKIYASEKLEDVDLHKPWIDKIEIVCETCKKIMRRIPEVIDCWVESASMPFAELHYPFENKELFKERFPAQFVAEYIAQTRAWFYVMHVIATIIFDKPPFENVVTTGNILNEKGEKLSKSKKNYPDSWSIIEKYGVDALRYYLMTSTVMKAENLFFSEREVDEVYKKVMLTILNVVSFYEMFNDGSIKNKKQSDDILDRWITAKLHKLIKSVSDNMNTYDIVDAARPIGEFIQDLSTWYVRRSRERVRGDDDNEKCEALSTLRVVLLELSKMMAPITPFMAEYVYKKTGGEKESVHLEDWPEYQEVLVDAALLDAMESVRAIVSLALEHRAKTGIKVRQPIASLKLKTKNEKLKTNDELLDLIKNEVNVKEIIFNENIADEVELDTTLTPELLEEGFMRELVRQIQDLRKQAGLTPKDKIILYLDPLLERFAQKWGEYIIQKTNAQSTTYNPPAGGQPTTYKKELNFGEKKVIIGIDAEKLPRP